MSGFGWYTDFRWVDSPLSHWHAPTITVFVYLVSVFSLSRLMRDRKGLELRDATAAHNMFLSAWSLVMFLGATYELWQRYVQTGTFDWFFCEYSSTHPEGPLFFWSYIYYMSKYYEMLDTLLVILQKSTVPFFALQVYHHVTVVPLVWLCLEYRMSLHWGGMVFNTFVHVVMYYYYARRTLGVKVAWKRWITKLQMIQFMTSFVLFAVTLKMHYDRVAVAETCSGITSLIVTICFNVTMLVQFTSVDNRNRRSDGGKRL